MGARACKVGLYPETLVSLKVQNISHLGSFFPRPSAPGILRGTQGGGGDKDCGSLFFQRAFLSGRHCSKHFPRLAHLILPRSL